RSPNLSENLYRKRESSLATAKWRKKSSSPSCSNLFATKPTFSSQPRSSKMVSTFPAPTPSLSIAPIASAWPNSINFAAAPDVRTTLNLGLDLRIPQEYIPTENLRLRTYKRVSSIRSEDERNDVARELADRFGKLPASLENLLDYAVLKSICERLRISAVERQGSRLA